MIVELEIYLQLAKLNDLGIKSDDDDIVALMTFDMDQLESFRQTATDEGDIVEDEIIIYTKSGYTYLIRYTYEGFKELFYKHKGLEYKSDKANL